MALDMTAVRRILEEMAEASPPRPAPTEIPTGADPADVALQEQLQDGLAIGAERITGLVRVARAALERINRGTFGTCVDCDQSIAERRLLAMPTATRCFDCQVRHEQQSNFGWALSV